MDENFSPRVKDVIQFSKEEAIRLGHRTRRRTCTLVKDDALVPWEYGMFNNVPLIARKCIRINLI